MHFLRLFVALLAVNFMTVTVAAADTTAKLRGPKEFDAPQQTRLGPLTPADTLWRLAEQARPDRRINMYQMMYALYQKNPDAFLEENFNHLKPGAFLLLPTVREILAVDALEAQRKSENDDRIWAERVRRAELAKAEAAAAKQLDIVTAKEQLSEELSRVEAQQTEQISDLRNRIGASMANVETIVQENTHLKQQLTTVVQELGAVKSQLDKDSEIQTQLQQLLAQQAELLEQQREQMRKAEEGFNIAATLQKVAASPIGWAVAGSLPAFILLYFIVSVIRRRGQKAAAVVSAATAAPSADPNYRSPLPPLDDSLDFDESSLINLDDSLLNDNLSAGIRLDNDAYSTPGTRSNNTAFSDDLLHDDFIASAVTKSTDEFDLDSLLDEPAGAVKPAAKTEFDANNILSGDDLSSLFDNLDDEPAFAPKAEFDPNNILSNNELSSLFDNLADEDDPDEIFNQAQAAVDAQSVAATDEQEDLLPELPVTAEALQNAAAEADEFDELLEEIELDIPADDEITADDEFDIDALLAATQQPMAAAETAPPIATNAIADDDFDIDSLLAANSQPELAMSLEENAAESEPIEQFDSSELDAFAESLAEEILPVQEQAKEEAVDLALDDDDNITELLEPDPTELHNELEDILSEVAELRAQSMLQTGTLAELSLPESALHEAAADFAESELTVADVSAMLQDAEPEVSTALDAVDQDLTEAVDDHLAPPDVVSAELATELHAFAEPDSELDEIIEIPELSEPQPLAGFELDDALVSSDEARSLLTPDEQLAELDSEAISVAVESSEDMPTAELPVLPADMTMEADTEFVGQQSELSIGPDQSSAWQATVDEMPTGFSAEPDDLLELPAVATEDILALMPDLQQGDDQSVSRVSEAVASVERPSQMLDSYPELDFNEELVDDELIFPDSLQLPDDIELAEAATDDWQKADDMPAELAELEELQFDQLLSELDELALPEDEEATVLPEGDDALAVTAAWQPESSATAAELAASGLAVGLPDETTADPATEFLQIDKLLASSEEEATEEQLRPLQIDVGLADFPDLISADEVGDVDKADAGFAGRLDLVRAYNEIGDADSAEQLVKEIMASDAPAHVKQEALSLLQS
jgi:FimV-like protein